jgi:hypothetical protein
VETRTDTLTAENAPAPDLVRAKVGALPVEPAPATGGGRRNPMRALRLPEQHDPAPESTRMIAMSGWAALLVLLGMLVAIRTLVAIVLAPGPGWLVPTVMSLGIAGTVCAALSFATIHHRQLPWQLLGLATLLLCGNLFLVIARL